MARKRARQRSSELRAPAPPGPAAPGTVDRRAFGPAPGVRTSYRVLAVCGVSLLLVAAVFLAYQPAWQGTFLWDDELHLHHNPVLRPGGLAGAWTPGGYINYWPLTFTVYRLEFEAWKLEPLGYHLVNIALHALCALLVWRVVAELDVPAALAAAALFALHPVNVESVAWVAQLKGILGLLLGLASLWFYLRHDRSGGGWRYAAAIAAFWLSTLAKGIVLTLPVVLLACAWWRRGRIAWKDLLRVLPFVLIAAVMTGLEIWTQHRSGEVVRSDGLLSRAAVAGCAVWFYLGKLLWPFDLCNVYPRWQIDDLDLLWYVPGLLLVVLLALSWRQRRSWGRPVVMLVVCYVALLLPVLGFVNIYYMKFSLVADHWQYPAMIVPCAALAGAAGSWVRRRPGRRPIAVAAGLLLLAALAGLTFQQSRMYADGESLYRATLAMDPDCWMAHNNLAVVLAGRGQVDEAIDHYHEAIRLNPDYAEAHNNLGAELADRGQADEAVAHFQRALEIRSDYPTPHVNLGRLLAARGLTDKAIAQYRAALNIKPDLPSAHVNLGLALAGRGEADEAIAHYQSALEIQPDLVKTHNNLGILLAGRRRVDEAIAHYRTALEIQPDYADPHFNLGFALAGRGQIDEAITHYQTALKIKPDYAEARNNLGVLLGGRGQVDAAIAHYRKALEINPKLADPHYHLGNALAGRGQLDAAIAHFQRALEIQPNYAEAHNNLGVLLGARGRVDAAIAHHRKAVEIKPDYAEAHNNLGADLERRGQLDEAIVHYQRALEIQPDYPRARQNLEAARSKR